jgi:hypothetical protein
LDIQSTSATLRIKNTTAPATGGTSSLLFEGINNFSGTSQSYINSIQAGNSGATQLTFGTSTSTDATATERMRITSAGLVGVGTSSPGTALEVVGVIQTQSGAFSGGGYNIKYNAGSAASRSWQILTDNYSYGDLAIQQSTTQTGSTYTPRLYISNTGNVGIGTTGPSSLLHLAAASGTIQMQFNNGGTSSFIGHDSAFTGLDIAAGGGIKFRYFNGASFAEAARIDTSGRLLVGTSSARSNFFNSTVSPLIQQEGVSGSSRFASITYGTNAEDDPIFILGKHRGASVGGTTVVNSGDGLGKISFQGSDGTEFVEGAAIRAEVDGTPGANDMPGRLVFSTTADGAASPTERMRISNAGLATFNSGTALIYNTGDIYTSILNDANANGFILDTGDGGAGDRPKFRIRYGTADQIFLDGNGTAQKPGGGSWAATSDLRSKEDVFDYTSGLDQLKQIQPRSYRYIGNENTYIGLVAQEVEDVMPELVKQGEGTLPDGTEVTDFRTLDQTPLTFALINAVKEMAATIETLEADVAALKGA